MVGSTMSAKPMDYFNDFHLEELDLPTGRVRLRHGGEGPPLLLLHGNPQTHAMWHATAPALAKKFHVYCPDIRGYGKTHKPQASDHSWPYAKREMARDIVALMDHFGISSTQIAAHDRGARIAHRMALDHPARVERLAILDIIPTIEHFEQTDMRFAMRYYHWFWLAQPHPFPEHLINRAPEDWFWSQTAREPKGRDFFAAPALADYLDSVSDPKMITGMCEDYRAAAGIDLQHDRESRDAKQRIECDVLALWGDQGIIGEFYDPLTIWQQYCNGVVSGHSVRAGHYLAEESPEEVLAAFGDFFVS
jgi:haloacetate dehalogenase